MRRLSHGTLLALANAGLVLLTVGALAATGALLVRRLVTAQAHQRAASAAATASREVRAAAERLEVGAKLLADRPGLQRLEATGRRRELAEYLARFRETSGIAGAAVLREGKLWASSGGTPPEHPSDATTTRWIAAPDEGSLLMVAHVGAEPTRVEVVLWQTLDETFAARLTRQVGMPVRIAHTGTLADEPEALVRAEAPLPAELTGVGVVVASLPREELVEPVSRLLRGYALAACVAAALALAAGLLLGQRLGAPAESLGQAALRIGAGDLHTPVAAPWGGEMGQLGATLEDMRRRLHALTAELARREAEATAVLGGIVEGVLAVDEERRVTYVNPGAAELLGLDADRARGRFCGDLLRPEPEGGSPPCHDRCPIVHARGRGTARALERIRPPGGTPRVVVVSCSPPESGSQVLVLRDETEQEAGRRVREVILANLSHELKTPLAAQLASVELLRDGLGAAIPPRDARELVAALERSTLRLMGLVDNLLASSRLEAGEWGMRSEAVDLPEVAEEAAALLAPLFAQRRQELAWELADLPRVRGDRTQLLQVLLNLLGNANKFAPDGSQVRVGGDALPGAVVLWVEDEGPGLPPGSEAALFERFRRAPGVAPRGVGLGLWIVRAVVERHGGTVAAGAGRLGGARFTVTLPRPEASAA